MKYQIKQSEKTIKASAKKKRNFPKTGKLNFVHFLLLSILIFILPVAKEWNTLLFGEKVSGTVVALRKFMSKGAIGNNDYIIRSAIQYKRGDNIYTVYGPENVKYEIGSELPLRLSNKKPGKFIIATFSGFYIQYRSISLIIVFIIWLAMYTTLVQIQKGKLINKK